MPTDDANPWDGSDGPAPEEPPPGDDRDDVERRRVLVAAAVVFVLLAAVAFFLTRGGDDEPAADSLPGQPGEEAAGGAVSIIGTADAFERPDTEDGLGNLPNGTPWQVQSGRWAIRAGTAAVVESAEGRNTVFVGTGFADPQVQVRIATMAPGAGLVFRYRGECNYWAVYAVPEIAVWNVEKVLDCAQIGGDGDRVLRVITEAPIADGTTVGVVSDGDVVRIVINGQVVTTIDDPDLAGVGRVGLTTKGPEATVARFDDVVVGGPEGEGVIAPDASGTEQEPDDDPAGEDPEAEEPDDTGADDGG